ncbi:MAG: glycosyltransferase family 39 protein, partial [Anaerolineae bacterium]|nr:glycosyltransferase family 39 protein [Anaerolineae bacterium]
MPAGKVDAKSNTTRERALDATALALSLILALALRLPGLSVFLTADEARSWFGRSLIFLHSLATANLANTGPGGDVPFIENVSLSPAPGVTTMWTGALGILIEYARQGFPGPLADFIVTVPFDPLDPAMLVWLRLPNVVLAAGAVGLTFWWSRPLLGRWGALLAAALVALDPFYLALSRVLGHDALVTTFMWLSLVALLRVLIPGPPSTARGSQTRFLILSGVAAGLAFLSKYPAFFIAAFTALALLLGYLSQTPHQPIRSTLNRWIKDV